MSQTGEEKSLPASDKKLRDARRKGQVSRSQDLTSGLVLLMTTAYLWFAGISHWERVEALIDTAAERVHALPFVEIKPVLLDLAGDILIWLAVPMLAVGVAAVTIGNVAVMRGFVFSVDPVSPDVQHINPVAGFKRIFSLRGVVEFAKAVVKVLVLSVAFLVVFRLGLSSLMQSSTCGAGCILGTFDALFRPLLITAVVAFLVVGIVDVLVQNWLFSRDQKMTKSEQKRERRDAEGDPAILRERRKRRQELGGHAARIGLPNASILIGGPGAWTVGIRYKRGDTPVPIVVCRASPEQAHTMIAQALVLDIPVVRGDDLASRIAVAARPGEPVPEATFQRVADLLVAAKMI